MKNFSKKIKWFLVITFLLSSMFYYIIIAGTIKSNLLSLGLMWTPAFSAIVIQIVYTKSIRGFGWKLGKIKYLMLSLLIPIVGCIIVYPIVWATGLGGVSVQRLSQIYGRPINDIIILLLPIYTLINLVASLGEEIGWRGFLFTELSKKYSYVKISLITSFVWFIWHCPVIMFSSYRVEGTHLIYNLIMAIVIMTAFTFIITWIRLKSESLWTAVIFHGIHNLVIQQIFDVITVDNGNTRYFTSEFGIGMGLFYLILGVFCWKRNAK